jgi:hypothetical protein
MKNNQERNMKNLFANNPEVTTMLDSIRANGSRYDIGEHAHSIYYELGALKAELHMIAQKFPEVEAYLAEVNASRADVKAMTALADVLYEPDRTLPAGTIFQTS